MVPMHAKIERRLSMNHPTGDWKVARTRRQECLRYAGVDLTLLAAFSANWMSQLNNTHTAQPMKLYQR